MLVNDDFDAGVVPAQQLAERTGFAHEYTAALPPGAVAGFDHVGLTGLVASVGPRRQHGSVGRPLGGVAPAVAPVADRQRGSEPAAAPRVPSTQATLRRLARSTASHSRTLRCLRHANIHLSSSSSTFQHLRWVFFGRRCGNDGAAGAAFFASLATVMRETSVAHAMLRCELRSASSFSTCA